MKNFLISAVAMVLPAIFALASGFVARGNDTVMPHLIPSVDSLTRCWDNSFGKAPAIDPRRIGEIDSLRRIWDADRSAGQGDLAFEIAEAYIGVDIDSAIIFFRRACSTMRAAGREDEAGMARSRRAAIMPYHNQLDMAFEEAERIDYDNVRSRFARVRVLMSALTVYDRVGRFTTDSVQRAVCLQRQNSIVDSLLSGIDGNTPLGNFLAGRMFCSRGKSRVSVASFEEAIDSAGVDRKLYPLVCLTIADCKEAAGEPAEALRYALAASLARVEYGDPQYEAGLVLGKLFLATGDFERASRALVFTLSQAKIAGAYLVEVEAGRLLNDVARAYAEKCRADISRYRATTLTAIGLLAVVVVAMGVSALRRGRRSAHGATAVPLDQSPAPVPGLEPSVDPAPGLRSDHIVAADESAGSTADGPNDAVPDNSPRERIDAMKRFIAVSSGLIGSTRQFNQMARQKLSAGRAPDLHEVVRDEKLLARQSEIFCREFDAAFTAAFPTFIDDINSLLLPDKQLSAPAPTRLTAELRILAMMKMGIDDGAEIARLIGVSVNTVYTYRNRMRSRALHRDTFERDLCGTPLRVETASGL